MSLTRCLPPLLDVRRPTPSAILNEPMARDIRPPSACHRDRFTCASRMDLIGSARKGSKCSGRDRIRNRWSRSSWRICDSRRFAALVDRYETRRFPGSAGSRSSFDHLRSIGASAGQSATNNEHDRVRRWDLTVLENFYILHKIFWGIFWDIVARWDKFLVKFESNLITVVDGGYGWGGGVCWREYSLQGLLKYR